MGLHQGSPVRGGAQGSELTEGPRSRRPLPASGAPAPAPVGDFDYACDLFDAGLARDAHEEWEVAWRALPRDASDAWFLKGLLCASAFVVKQQEGSPGAVRLWERTGAAFQVSPTGFGLDARPWLPLLRAWSEGGAWPKLP